MKACSGRHGVIGHIGVGCTGCFNAKSWLCLVEERAIN